MKKTLALLLTIVLLMMAGCGSSKEYLTGAVSDTGVVAIGIPGEPMKTDRVTGSSEEYWSMDESLNQPSSVQDDGPMGCKLLL